jgi:rubrerythrin
MAEPGSPLTTDVESIAEMLAMADAMEREAAARYGVLAECMRRVDQGEIADLLDSLAAEERGHVESVERLARQTLHGGPDPTLVRRQLPETFGKADDAGAAALLSPYRALSIAVRGEERAFAFWTYVAAEAADATLRELAERFARQELIHAAKLRHARRRAYHSERRRPFAARRDEEAPPPPAEIRAEAAGLERRLAAFCSAAADRLRTSTDRITAELFASLAVEAGRTAAALASTTGRPARDSDRQPQERRGLRHGTNSAALLFEAAGMIETLDYRYLDWLNLSADGSLVKELETLAQATTDRLARVNERLFALEPGLTAIGGRSDEK